MSGALELFDTPLPGVSVVQRKPLGDERGYLERMFCWSALHDLLGTRNIVQINRTFTALRGTVRGLHYQRPPHAELKIVSCLKGAVFDVAVDVRRGSTTFLRWHGELLSAENHRTLVIAEGFAHGFQTLANDCELLYLHTAAFAQDSEAALNALDPWLGIAWPEPITLRSARDAGHPLLTSAFDGVPT